MTALSHRRTSLRVYPSQVKSSTLPRLRSLQSNLLWQEGWEEWTRFHPNIISLPHNPYSVITKHRHRDLMLIVCFHPVQGEYRNKPRTVLMLGKYKRMRKLFSQEFSWSSMKGRDLRSIMLTWVTQERRRNAIWILMMESIHILLKGTWTQVICLMSVILMRHLPKSMQLMSKKDLRSMYSSQYLFSWHGIHSREIIGFSRSRMGQQIMIYVPPHFLK